MVQRVIQGTVVSDKMDKTVVVAVERRKKHPLYHKVMTTTSRFKAHDEQNNCRLGDVVRIIESRPLSREKRWRVVEVLSRGDVAEVAPQTIGREIEESVATAREEDEAVEAQAETAKDEIKDEDNESQGEESGEDEDEDGDEPEEDDEDEE